MSEEKKIENNVDDVMQKVRKLQEHIYDFKKTPNELFKFTAEIIKSIEVVSKQVRENNK